MFSFSILVLFSIVVDSVSVIFDKLLFLSETFRVLLLFSLFIFSDGVKISTLEISLFN